MQRGQYQDLQQIHISDRNIIYRANEPATGNQVILKIAFRQDAAGLFNEAGISRELPGAYHRVDLDRWDDSPAMVRDYVEGVPLRKLIGENGMVLSDFFRLAIPMTDALQKVHENAVLHLDINPDNLIVNTPNSEIRFIDFEQSAKLESRELIACSLREIEGSLRYLAPEQTGRMNRRVDYRSDYYSLGATFYEMLCGRPPFEADDLLTLVHAHLAILPDAPEVICPGIPPILGRLILKLLAKNAEDRYQSLIGLRTDLFHCQQEWRETNRIEPFVLAESDRIGRLNISQKLYGREPEIATLEATFERVSQGERALVLLSGFSGVGKSTLAQELYRPVTAGNGLFLWGKFDAIQRSTPYYAWLHAFDQLIDWLLAEPEETLYSWRTKILSGLNGLGRVLTQLMPRLTLLLGEQPELERLPARENQQRLQFAITSFIAALAGADQPLVLFLDDWQWADEASTQLLESLFARERLHHLMLIAAFRSNEVAPGDPFLQAGRRIREYSGQSGIPPTSVREVDVLPLSVDSTTALLSDTLHAEESCLRPLAEAIYAKTHGNGFATANLLQELYEKKGLAYNFNSNQWEWDLAPILQQNISSDVADWLLAKVQRLPEPTQKVLQVASATGSTFRLGTIAPICQFSQSETHRWLWQAIRDGVVEPEDSQYKYLPEYYEEQGIDLAFRFVHDRIQQAVYQTIPSTERNRFHFEAGRQMLPLLQLPQKDTVLFDVAQHFANGFDFIAGSGLEGEVGPLLLEAGEKAYQSASFEVAFPFLHKGLHVQGLDEIEQEAILDSYVKLIESAYMSGLEAEKEVAVRQALSRCRTSAEQARIREVWIRSLIAASRFDEAKRIAREALAGLGVRLPGKASKLQVIVQAIRTGRLLPASRMDQINTFPLMTDVDKLAAMRLLATAAPAFHLTDVNTYAVLILTMIQLSVNYGNCPESILGYSSYGIILTAALNKPQEGYLIGKQSLRLVEKLQAYAMEPIAYFVDGAFIAHIREPLSACLDSLQKGYQSAMRTGNLDYATWCLYFANYTHYLQGYPLPELAQDIEATIRLKKQYRQFNQLDKELFLREVTRRLVTLNDQPGVWQDDQFDEEEILRTSSDNISLLRLHTEKGMTLFWYERYDAAWEAFDRADRYLKSAAGTLSISQHLLYQSLVGIHSRFFQKSKVARRIRNNLKQLRAMEQINPATTRYACALIEAELAATQNAPDARRQLEEAVRVAEEDDFRFAAAYGRRRLGVWLQQHGDAEARNVLLQACATFTDLGMNAMETLTRRYYLPDTLERTATDGKGAGARGATLADLDAITLVKTTQALTAEIKLDRLSEKLMRYAIENAGAQRGWLILRRNGEWIVEIGMEAAESQGRFHRLPLAGCGLLAETAVNYAAKTRQPLLIDDAGATMPFSQDDYVRRNNSKSILCIPFLHQSEIAGFIYLSNDLTTGAFTRERVELLTLLAGQMGVSIENAMLYEQMEDLVRKRTQQLEEEKKKSDDLLLNILPEEVADELKSTGKSKARRYESVSVLFADIKDFTLIAERISAEQLVEELDYCFKVFDEIIERHGLEKIKTVGDAYICAAGLPAPDADHAAHIVQAARDMQAWVAGESERRRRLGQSYFQVRIGIHSGPVVAGIVGSRKFAYDIWGDTVNVAARMEQNGEPGKINISETTFDLLENRFSCHFRGEVSVKNKADMRMYFVE